MPRLWSLPSVLFPSFSVWFKLHLFLHLPQVCAGEEGFAAPTLASSSWWPSLMSMWFWGVHDSLICPTGGRLWCADGQDCWMCYKSPVLQKPGLELKQDNQTLGLGHTTPQNELQYLFWELLAGHLYCALDSKSVLLHRHVKLWLSRKLARPRFLQICKYKSCQTIKDNYYYLAD